jgi:photosystem II stability/assembly factor-like uncharacterized protein
MNEDLELLARAFESDDAPSQDDWDRVFEQVGRAAATEHTYRSSTEKIVRLPRRRAAMAVIVVSAAAALIAAAAIVLPHKSPSGSPAVISDWSLASSIQSASFQSTTGASDPYAITCPSPTTCYTVVSTLVALPGTSGGTGNQGDEFPLPTTIEVSKDGGSSWQPLTLPAGIWLDTAITCPSVSTCMIGAESPIVGAGQPDGDVHQLFLESTDGGAQWSEQIVPIPPLPGPFENLVTQNGDIGSWNQLQCFSASTCFAFGTVPSGVEAEPVDSGNPVVRTEFMRTDDGGSSWTTYDFPWIATPSGAPAWSNAEQGSFTCASQSFCVGLVQVFSAPSDGAQVISTLEWVSRDRGETWTHSWEPYPIADDGGLTCTSGFDCAAVGADSDIGATSAGTNVIETVDGGATWKLAQIPMGRETQLSSVSCPTTVNCWAAGSKTLQGYTSAVILQSSDGGMTWVTDTVPTDVDWVGVIDCPSSESCYAVAASTDSNTITNEQILVNQPIDGTPPQPQ